MDPVVLTEVSVSSTPVTTVLTAITTYMTNYVGEISTWMTSFIPAIMPVIGIAISIFFAVKIVKRLSKG